MESGCILCNKRHKIEKLISPDMIKISGHSSHYGMKFEKKTVETKTCKFCGMKFERKSIYCIKCGSCQYCGLKIGPGNRCPYCGNQSNKNDNIEIDKHIIH